MDAQSVRKDPLRPPQWRAYRATYLAEHRPRPLSPSWYDDHYVRAYRRFLIAFMDAGDDEAACYATYLAQPHVHHAHLFRFHPDREWEHILQARLLTGESTGKIAERLAAEPKTIDYYEQLFFNVRSRLHNSDWIDEVILGSPDWLGAGRDGVMTADQRGFLYRLLAYYGGPKVLAVAIHNIGPATMPESREDLAGWIDNAVDQIVESWTAAARGRELDTDNVVNLLELAVGPHRTANTSKARRRRPPSDFDLLVAKLVPKLTGRTSTRRRSKLTNTR